MRSVLNCETVRIRRAGYEVPILGTDRELICDTFCTWPQLWRLFSFRTSKPLWLTRRLTWTLSNRQMRRFLKLSENAISKRWLIFGGRRTMSEPSTLSAQSTRDGMKSAMGSRRFSGFFRNCPPRCPSPTSELSAMSRGYPVSKSSRESCSLEMWFPQRFAPEESSNGTVNVGCWCITKFHRRRTNDAISPDYAAVRI